MKEKNIFLKEKNCIFPWKVEMFAFLLLYQRKTSKQKREIVLSHPISNVLSLRLMKRERLTLAPQTPQTLCALTDSKAGQWSYRRADLVPTSHHSCQPELLAYAHLSRLPFFFRRFPPATCKAVTWLALEDLSVRAIKQLGRFPCCGKQQRQSWTVTVDGRVTEL